MTGLPGAQPSATVVFEVATARRVGAQLRYIGGVRLAEVRVAYGMHGKDRLIPLLHDRQLHQCQSRPPQPAMSATITR
ncbi:hypothetical protein EV384_3621 [Micromonospora kangleipakensis]|uniref:Uncharacterized protein n=1 Tax=Micromonospora kangleipakensis TaxID=1077942 RepID=A0A4Q8BBB3_9ACTN|nr:hypothetical protein [Micromonospora kangleipakensis]RZU75097.1 hypothetical protein EV384_3621 [Micromonospora kangleipakensis]